MKEESNQDMSCDSDDDVKEETTSSEDDDEDSFDANMKGDDFQTDDEIYQRILANQSGDQEMEEEKKTEDLDSLIDKNMINLLMACSLLKRPSQ